MKRQRRQVAGHPRPRPLIAHRGVRLLVQSHPRRRRSRKGRPHRLQIGTWCEILVHQPEIRRRIARIQVLRPARGPDHHGRHPRPLLARSPDPIHRPGRLHVDRMVAPDPRIPGPSIRQRHPPVFRRPHWRLGVAERHHHLAPQHRPRKVHALIVNSNVPRSRPQPIRHAGRDVEIALRAQQV